MALSSGRLVNSNSLQSSYKETTHSTTAFVQDVILDENHPYAKFRGAGSSYIGSIRFRKRDNLSVDISELPIAHPMDKNFKNLPVKNELVEIYEITKNNFLYRRIGTEVNPTDAAVTNAISSAFPETKQKTNQAKDYQTQINTGISKSNKDNSKDYDGFGKYYNPIQGIHKLKLYEGDSLIESRFGQSIRFSGYNNDKHSFSPTIIIRNSESSLNSKKDRILGIEEDINRDGSVIVLSSNQHQLGFVPGTIDDKGKSDFQTQPDSFMDYPSKLIGDQLLLNSGRIILSAKSGEMIFYSKKNYGFISDGALSIDNKLGIDISVGDNINVITNDRDINFVTGNGSIFFGSKNLEPMVKGQQLVDLLAELMDAISQMQFLTPSGPSALGPVNVSQFGTLKSKLNNILSKSNQIS